MKANCVSGSCNYGVGPHICFHKLPGASVGQSVMLSDEGYENYEPDPEVPGLGVWHNCGYKRES